MNPAQPELEDAERHACIAIEPAGFHLRPPPPPHLLGDRITDDAALFETIHMGAAVVDLETWRLRIDGRVDRPFTLDWAALQALPAVTVTAVHECYGSPLTPPVTALGRVGNVRWTGVPLAELLARAGVQPEGAFVWTDGLDHGEFAGRSIDRYRKDLPLAKALAPEVLVAYALNGEPLRKERGGPVRLVVPGWFGTNMTKWLCRVQVQRERAPGPFTTDWYNEATPDGPRPVWAVEPNAVIVSPAAGVAWVGRRVRVSGWAWSDDGIAAVQVSSDGGVRWSDASVEPRIDFSWQRYQVDLLLPPGPHAVTVRATSIGGVSQPLRGRRNHAPTVRFTVDDAGW